MDEFNTMIERAKTQLAAKSKPFRGSNLFTAEDDARAAKAARSIFEGLSAEDVKSLRATNPNREPPISHLRHAWERDPR